VIHTYIDTSAAVKLIVDEPESEALLIELDSGDERVLLASWLLHTELHCAIGRQPSRFPRESVKSVLSSMVLTDLTRDDLVAAGTHAPLRAQDAIHLATALRLGCAEMLTYDAELAAAAHAAGITAVAPA
jgi:uncharacterized protein